MSEAMTTATVTNGQMATRRTRRGKKRLVFQPPRLAPISVRRLWDSASTEEKSRAHETCVAILSMWLGRKTRTEVASDLSLPPLRVWQLSQAAVSGMLAGLLKQPRGRGRSATTMQTGSEEDPRALKKRISELEAENRALKELLALLQSLPAVAEQRDSALASKKKKKETRDKKRQTTLANLKEGQLIQGMVKNITDYGAFIDLGGIDGLLHITDMSWGRVGHPSEMFTVGDRVEVNVLKYDRETGRISLGLKQKSADPWTNVAGKYPIGTRVRGRVVSLTDYGAFIELEPGIEGLVHISEIDWGLVENPKTMFKIGEKVRVKVIEIKDDKISLSIKALKENPWREAEKKYKKDDTVQGIIIKFNKYGALASIEEGVAGLVHLSEFGSEEKLREKLEMGKVYNFKITLFDPKEQKMALSFVDKK